ncbi:tyrosine-type recombinase/integrase [Lysinibacillus sp. FSL L8-0126]|uniref:tyrosine-type recombinase/integrase n=1 Tax=Lysinibacillus sp. FSL L8-0126 TaxID=2921515 RepID=UPI00315A2888
MKPHNIRRSYATNLCRKGVNVAVISKALGRSSLVVTERYLEIDVDLQTRKVMLLLMKELL